jgi:hypothetical protein
MYNLIKGLNSLFISKVRIKAIKYFIFNPDVPIHLRGAVRDFQEEINAVRRELSRLEEIGFLTSESRGNRKYFMLNKDYPYINELLGMFHKTFGLGGAILQNIDKLGDIKFVILSGTFTNFLKPSSHNVDMVVIGDVNVDVLNGIVEEAEKKINRQINYTILKGSEFILRKKRRDVFIMELLIGNKILVVGNNEDLVNF